MSCHFTSTTMEQNHIKTYGTNEINAVARFLKQTNSQSNPYLNLLTKGTTYKLYVSNKLRHSDESFMTCNELHDGALTLSE